MENIVILDKVSVTYRDKHYQKNAVDDLSLLIESGEVFGFLGPNGAGKTTTIKTMLGLIYPDKGEICLFGKSAKDYSLRSRLGYMPEIANYYWYLTPYELLIMYAGFFGINKENARKKTEELLALVDLKEAGCVLMKKFSKGMMQKVSLAQALINDPDLLILDEPTSGLDPVARMKVRDIIKSLKSQGKTIFFSSHELSEVELICDRVGIMKDGKLITVEKMEEILKKKQYHQSLEQYFFNIITRGKDE